MASHSRIPDITGENYFSAKPSDFGLPVANHDGKIIDGRSGIQRIHSEPEIELALQRARGFRSVAATQLDMSINGLNKRIRESPHLKQLLHDIDTYWLDKTEVKLFEAIDRGELAAICFHLKFKGRARGYVERREFLMGIAVGEFDEAQKPPALVLNFSTEVNKNAPSGTTASDDLAQPDSTSQV